MATSPILHFLLLSLFLSCRFSVYGATTTLFDLVPVESLRPSSICSPSSSGTAGAKVVYRHGPCSPLRDKYPPPTSHQILQNDQYRVEFLNTHKPMDPDTTKFGVGVYLVTVQLGTPTHDYPLIMDTGSDLTWFQCQPCSSACPARKELIFVPSASSTYYPANKCNSIYRYTTGCFTYHIPYFDHTYSKGCYAIDSLTIPGSGTIPSFRFGCGHHNSPEFGDYAGVLGLSNGGCLSIVAQDTPVFGQVFCYCLRENTTGFLLFGSQAASKCRANAFTPLLANPKRSSLYFVDLVGITIGTKRVAVTSSLSSGDPNTVLDSGTAITRLPPLVYAAVKAEFRRLMSGYRESGRLPPLLDTCYDIGAERDVAIPKMTLHFKGVDVGLHWSGVIWQVNASRVCLGFAGNQNDHEFNIIGSTQQKTMGILYDIKQKRVKFMANAC